MPAEIIDLWPYIEDDMLDRAFANRRARERRREKLCLIMILTRFRVV